MNFIKYIFLFIVVFSFSETALAQDTISKPSTVKKRKKLRRKKRKALDTVSIAKKSKEKKSAIAKKETPKNVSLSDSVVKVSTPIIDNEKTKKQLKNIKIDTDFGQKLKDNRVLVEFDEHWKQELMNHDLFDTIQKTVERQKYEKFIYEADLPTDSLKVHLKQLNARTPFNVEYNPSLESVIRNFLKNRHLSMERLMALSEYYFPLFEEVLDRYDLPLEIKYSLAIYVWYR